MLAGGSDSGFLSVKHLMIIFNVVCAMKIKSTKTEVEAWGRANCRVATQFFLMLNKVKENLIFMPVSSLLGKHRQRPTWEDCGYTRTKFRQHEKDERASKQMQRIERMSMQTPQIFHMLVRYIY